MEVKSSRDGQRDSTLDDSNVLEGQQHSQLSIDSEKANLADQTISKKSSAPVSNKRMTNNLRICLLEDSHSTGQTTQDQLSNYDYVVDQYLSVKDGHRALFDHNYDLLVISHPIGATSTEYFIDILRNRDKFTKKQLPIVVIIPEENPADLKNLQNAGADVVVSKPSQLELSNVIESVVAHKKPKFKPKKDSSHRSLVICVFEDNYPSSKIIIDKLSEHGHTVNCFSSVNETLAALSTNYYDLLVANQTNDSGMESMRLIESFCTQEKRDKRKFPIVVLTSDTSSENIKSLTSAGANLVVPKYINGKLNGNIFEVIQIISLVPKKDGETVAPKIPELVTEVTTTTTMKDETQISALNTINRADDIFINEKPQQSSYKFQGQVDTEQHSSAVADEPEIEDKTSKRLPFSGLSQRLAIIGISFVAIVSAGLVYWQENFAAVPVEVVEARQGVLTNNIRGTGRIITRKQVNLTSAMPGQLARIFVEEGGIVKKGDVLATLDDREAKVGLKRAKVELAIIKSDVSLKTWSLKELKQTQDAGSVISAMVKDLEAGLVSAKGKQRIAEEELRAMQLSLERLKIVAPFDAVVLESYAVEGLWAEASEPLFKLIDPNRFEAAIKVSGAQALDIDVGQPVIMSNNAYADEWEGKVSRVAFDNNDSTRDNETLVYASLGIDTPTLHYGQPVDTRIITKTSGDAIKLPFETIFEQNGRMMVAVVEDNRVKFQPIDIGIQDLTEVEVVNGISLGQQVILPGAILEPGARVEFSVVNGSETEEELGFPYREKYSNVAIVTTDQLRKLYDDSIIVDTRSNFEFNVVHINKAVNIPLSSENFLSKLEALRAKNSSKSIVFYCNGHTCTKSYKAAQKAAEAGFENVYAYDSGIFDWLRDNRDYTRLLDITPAPFYKLVSIEYFNSRLLSLERFQKKSADSDTVVIDIRDDLQKTTKLAMPTVELPLDQLLVRLNAGEFKNKQLLIFDAVGKQVRWLQYMLKDKGYSNYYFLNGGIVGATGS